MIPNNISQSHILKAIAKIDSEGVPSQRNSRVYLLKINSKFYPPKLVISYANIFANGYELSSKEFTGGKMTNTFLSNLGFTIVKK